MKTSNLAQSLNQFHGKCVCQICSCHKHTCPHSEIHIPHSEISTYQKQYDRKPIHTWQKPPPQKAKPYTPYDYINSKYREDYPGHKPQMRQKIVPRVKNEQSNIPFNSTSQYFKQYGPKSVPKSKVFHKDSQFVPDNQPFMGSTTYGAEFGRKKPNPHSKIASSQVLFPEGYRFNPNTTYNNDFFEKKSSIPKSYKPLEKIGEKGSHDLTSIYQQDFKEKPQPHICPVLQMPTRPSQVSYPHQHLTYNKISGSWLEN